MISEPEVVSTSLRKCRTLILDGHSSAALAFVRSLGRAGAWVAVGRQKGQFAPASYSRYCKKTLEYEPPVNSATEFAEIVKAFAARHDLHVIAPMTDATMWPLAKHRKSLEPAIVIAPELSAIETVSDKFWVWQTARELGLATPQTIRARSLRDLDEICWPFPSFVKDRFSIRWSEDRGLAGRVEYTSTIEDLRRKVHEHIDRFGEVLIQSYSPGVGIGISCLMIGGRGHMPFQWQRLREKDPRGSGSSAQTSRPVDARLLRLTEALLARAGFEGVAMAEFRLDTRTDTARILEINGRPWGSLQLAVHCGLNYPARTILWHKGGELPAFNGRYKEGIACRYLAADLAHLEKVFSGKPDDWPFPYPSLLGTSLKVAIPWYPGLRYADLSLHDPWPGLLELYKWVGSHF